VIESRQSGRIRLLSAFELEALAELHAACFAEAWDEAALAALLALPGGFAFIDLGDSSGSAEAAPAGFVLAWASAGESEILSLGIRPALRRRGIARNLLAAAIGEVRQRGAARIFLEVAAENWAARTLYLGAGFVQIGRRANYYRRPGGSVDALVLARDIANGCIGEAKIQK
jgi:[ribosomal protein S18]-alanine N-acetyltransferase